nr:hypothetical protein CFP56_53859 [Quercus suber]
MLHCYTMVLIGELQVARGHIPCPPHIPGQGPIIPPYKPRYMPIPLSPTGNWGSFALGLWPPQDLGYTPGTSDRAGPSTNPLASDGDDDGGDDDANQFIINSFRDDDS